MPLPVRYIDSHEYHEDGTVLKPHYSSDSPQPVLNFPILEIASSTGKLQALGLHNITSVIRQLGSLAKHAESVMGDIADILVSYHQRTMHLEGRTKHLSEHFLSSLDADREACEGFVIPHPDCHFKSDRHIDQQLLSKQYMPQALMEQMKLAYSPALYHFNSLWDDGRNAMYFYSNPNFFFEHWRNSMRREAMRRKSTVDNLNVTTSGQTQSRSSSESKKKKKKINHKESSTRQGDKDHANQVRPVGGSKSLKRNTRLSKSFHSHHDRLRHYHGSSLSLQEAGMRAQSKSFSRTYSFRAVSGSSSTRYSFYKKNRSKLHSHFSKVTAANFDGPVIELSVPGKSLSEGLEEEEELSTERTRGMQFRRTLSTRGSNNRSRSRSPNPKSDLNDSVFTGMHMYTVVEQLSQQEKSKLSTLSKQHLQSLDLATSDFQACLSIDSNRRLNSTFTPPSSIFARSITPILSLVNATPIASEQTSNPMTQSHHPRREPPPIPKAVVRPSHTSSDTKEHRNKLPKFQRSATISTGNPVIRKTAENIKKMYMSGNGRPASVALVEDQLVELLTPFNPNTTSLSSLDSNTNSKSGPMSSSPDQPHGQTSLESLKQSLTSESQTPTLITSQVCNHNTKMVYEGKAANMALEDLKSSDSNSTPNCSPVPGPPPPPPPRNDSLNNYLSSGPSIPVVACAPQRHSSLDTSQKENIANALSNVLKHTHMKELPNSPDKPLSPSSPSSGTVFSADNVSPSALPSTDLNRLYKVMSPKDAYSTTKLTERSIATESSKQQRPPPLIKQGSLYISPRKLSTAALPPLEDIGGLPKRKPGQILLAGGVDSGDLSGSRSNLLEAIRKGIQLRKVEEIDEDRKYEEAAPWDVAAILERYEVLHSDTSDSESEGEIQDWDDLDDI